MNWQSRGGGAVQSEIGLMLPTTAPGPYSEDREKPYKGTSDFSFKVKAIGLQTDKVCEPPKNMFSSRICSALRRFGPAVCIADL